MQSPSEEEISRLKQGAVYIGFIDISSDRPTLESLTNANISAIALERIPRISRAQSMDALSSQAGITGYRSVIEAAYYYGRFFPLMMTSAGSAKPAKVTILGAGVAGLQAIATAKRLGAQVVDLSRGFRCEWISAVHCYCVKSEAFCLSRSGGCWLSSFCCRSILISRMSHFVMPRTEWGSDSGPIGRPRPCACGKVFR